MRILISPVLPLENSLKIAGFGTTLNMLWTVAVKLRTYLRAFWTDHGAILPIHQAVYVSEVGCIKAAAANVESVFSGAGKFTQEASTTGSTLLRCVCMFVCIGSPGVGRRGNGL